MSQTINHDLLSKALKDYTKHSQYDMPQYSETFINELSTIAAQRKSILQSHIMQHPDYIPSLDLIRTVVPIPQDETNTYEEQLEQAFRDLARQTYLASQAYTDYMCWINLFIHPELFENSPEWNLFDALFPDVYKKGRKLSRVFNEAMHDILNFNAPVVKQAYNRCFARISDLLNHRHQTITLYVSCNPAYICTASNPRHDDRGETLISCHSLDNDTRQRTGNISLALDSSTLVAFTIDEPSKFDHNKPPAQLFSRKTSRQFFHVKLTSITPMVVSSRMYATTSEQAANLPRATAFNSAILSIFEPVRSIEEWITVPLLESDVFVCSHDNYRGYSDVDYEYNDPMLSTLIPSKDIPPNKRTVYFGAAPLCEECGAAFIPKDHETSCEACDTILEMCDNCCADVPEEEITEVVSPDGSTRFVCSECLQDYFYCEACGEWHHVSTKPATRVHAHFDYEHTMIVCADCYPSHTPVE